MGPCSRRGLGGIWNPVVWTNIHIYILNILFTLYYIVSYYIIYIWVDHLEMETLLMAHESYVFLPPPQFCPPSWIPSGLFHTSIKYHSLHLRVSAHPLRSLFRSRHLMPWFTPWLSTMPSSHCLWTLSLHSVSVHLSPLWLRIHSFVSLTWRWAPWGLYLCFSHASCFPGLWEDWCHELASLTDSTYVPEDSVGGLHASVNVVRDVAMQQPRPWMISKQLNGLKGPGKEIIHIFSVGLIYLQKAKDVAHGFFCSARPEEKEEWRDTVGRRKEWRKSMKAQQRWRKAELLFYLTDRLDKLAVMNIRSGLDTPPLLILT